MGWFTDLKTAAKEQVAQTTAWVEQEASAAVDWMDTTADKAVDFVTDQFDWGQYSQAKTEMIPEGFNWDPASLSVEQGVKDFATPFVKYPTQTVVGIAINLNTYRTEALQEVGPAEAIKDMAILTAKRVWEGMEGPVGTPKRAEYDANATLSNLLYDLDVQNETALEIADIVDLITNPHRWEFK